MSEPIKDELGPYVARRSEQSPAFRDAWRATHCDKCHKRNYSRTNGYRQVLASAVTLRMYRCPHSTWWHLTSRADWRDGERQR